MTIDKLYLGDAFGWDTENNAKVAIAQLRENNSIKCGPNDCSEAQLIKNGSIRWLPNALKILGYIPVVNIIAGIVAIATSKDNSSVLGPNHTARWRGRGVAMIIGGPLLFIVDLIKFICDHQIVKRYQKDYSASIEAFNTSHEHTVPCWPGHPVKCLNA